MGIMGTIHASPKGYAGHSGNYVPRPHFVDIIKQNKSVARRRQLAKTTENKNSKDTSFRQNRQYMSCKSSEKYIIYST